MNNIDKATVDALADELLPCRLCQLVDEIPDLSASSSNAAVGPVVHICVVSRRWHVVGSWVITRKQLLAVAGLGLGALLLDSEQVATKLLHLVQIATAGLP
jgi:hypothetical protein